MNSVAVYSIKGGSGATTVVAQLGAALKSEGFPVLLIDLCPNNLLRLHMAMDWKDGQGLSQVNDDETKWYETCYQNQDGIDFIPFGQGDPLAVNALFEKNKTWLMDDLKRLDLADNCWVIIDCPSADKSLQSLLSKQVDQTLLVINADPASYAHLQRYPDVPGKRHGLINNYNPLMKLERDINDLLHATYKGFFVPLNVSRDEAIRESLAFKQTIFRYASHSQAAHDYNTLATWLRHQDKAEIN